MVTQPLQLAEALRWHECPLFLAAAARLAALDGMEHSVVGAIEDVDVVGVAVVIDHDRAGMNDVAVD